MKASRPHKSPGCRARRASAAGPPILGALVLGAAANAANLPPPPLGRWLTHNHKGVFAIASCGTTLCGTLVGIRYPAKFSNDQHRSPQCDEKILTGFKRDRSNPDRWTGKILNPKTNRRYHAKMWSPSPGLLKVRGYVMTPLFGETRRWTSYNGPIGPNCHLPES